MYLDHMLVQITSVIASAAEQNGQEVTGEIVPLDLIWDHITNLGMLESLTFMSFGVVCLLYGWRVFKVLVVISFALMGIVGGIFISNKIGGVKSPLLAVMLSIVMAIVSIPLMRWAVSILGAVAGGIITAAVWHACQLPEQYIWAGGLVGVVAGGMISFIVFKIAVMLFSSLGGSALVAISGLGLLYQYPQTSESITQLYYGHSWFLPAVLAVPTVVGIYFQNKLIKGSPNWSV